MGIKRTVQQVNEKLETEKNTQGRANENSMFSCSMALCKVAFCTVANSIKMDVSCVVDVQSHTSKAYRFLFGACLIYYDASDSLVSTIKNEDYFFIVKCFLFTLILNGPDARFKVERENRKLYTTIRP